MIRIIITGVHRDIKSQQELPPAAWWTRNLNTSYINSRLPFQGVDNGLYDLDEYDRLAAMDRSEGEHRRVTTFRGWLQSPLRWRPYLTERCDGEEHTTDISRLKIEKLAASAF